MPANMQQLIIQSSALGSLPAVVVRISEAIDDPKSTAMSIGRVINEDPALTARLLKVVNSPFYGFRAKVDTVYRAIALIGHSELRNLVLGTSAIKVFGNVSSDLINIATFWRRSLYTGVLARVIASYRRQKEIERYFIGGLLTDIGSLLLYTQEPKLASECMEVMSESSLSLVEVEKDIYGFTHAELGGALLEKWSLPPMLCNVVAHHLEPDGADDAYKDDVLTVHVAHELMLLLDVAGDSERELLEVVDIVPHDLWESIGLELDILPSLLERASQQFEGIRQALLSD